MRVWARWNGGASYTGADLDRDVEVFPSIRAAQDALVSRARSGYWQRQTFTYADGRVESVFTPVADDGASMWLYFYDPREIGDAYPDRVLEFGARGGVVMSNG